MERPARGLGGRGGAQTGHATPEPSGTRSGAQWSNTVRSLAEINNTKTAEVIPVVSMPTNYVSSAHLAEKTNFT